MNYAVNSPINDPLSQALAKIEELESAAKPKITWRCDWTQAFRDVEATVDSALNQWIDATNETTANELVKIIKERREKLPLSSGTTTQIVGICQNILAFGAGGLALTVGFIDKIRAFSVPVQKLLAIIGIFYFELVAVSVLVLFWYLLQARFRYPSIYFEKIGNSWPYFYYASMTPVSRSPIQNSATRFEAATAYAKDMLRFASAVLSETPKQRLRVELQQYFLFLSYQAYAHQFSLRLVSLFTYGLVSAVATVFVMLALHLGGRL